MPLAKIADARNLSDEELAEEIAAAKRSLFDLRFQKATRQLETGFHQFKHTRHRLAQLMTVERERQLAAAQAAQTEPAQAAAGPGTETESDTETAIETESEQE
ncbi:50S ribosomal protein L29 [Romeria aff. gracilis LEGE 07310]|uniref:Large ribosomal subunit protein uL29 n=1 Tax=Vasconcelosia minhoensis LEGE 07310 TaxID=915328 RepID=A0A8J7AP21_9CYAN|nr:50S ribosomal protein L29 [Romeria gracilis]MBE9077641.1 50S ribosomal protein L29 [Romeria aff. gracilis LEGE 07310]